MSHIGDKSIDSWYGLNLPCLQVREWSRYPERAQEERWPSSVNTVMSPYGLASVLAALRPPPCTLCSRSSMLIPVYSHNNFPFHLSHYWEDCWERVPSTEQHCYVSTKGEHEWSFLSRTSMPFYIWRNVTFPWMSGYLTTQPLYQPK